MGPAVPSPVPTNSMSVRSTWPYVAKSSEPHDANGGGRDPEPAQHRAGLLRRCRVVDEWRLPSPDDHLAAAAVRRRDALDGPRDPLVEQVRVLRVHRAQRADGARALGDDVGRG